jgi:ankyrin repeat protein
LDYLGNKTRISKVLEALDHLPPNREVIYHDTMLRIKQKVEDHQRLAFRTLSWISNALRPLQIDELQAALTVEVHGRDNEHVEPESAALIVDVCKGLATIDSRSGTIRLAHYSVEEYFKNKGHGWFPDAEKLIAETCLTYLSSDTFAGESKDGSGLYMRLERHPLLHYAVKHWGFHAHNAYAEVRELSSKFLSYRNAVATAFLVAEDRPRRKVRFGSLPRVPSLSLMAIEGFHNFAHSWLDDHPGTDVDSKDNRGMTPLMYAALRGHMDMVKLLMCRKADVNARSIDGLTALGLAFLGASSECARILLEDGAGLDISIFAGGSAFHQAVQSKQLYLVKILVEKNADIYAYDRRGFSSLILACRIPQNVEVINYLLQQGADISKKSNNHRTAWEIACLYGYSENAQALVASGLIDKRMQERELATRVRTVESDNVVQEVLRGARVHQHLEDLSTSENLLRGGAGHPAEIRRPAAQIPSV